MTYFPILVWIVGLKDNNLRYLKIDIKEKDILGSSKTDQIHKIHCLFWLCYWDIFFPPLKFGEKCFFFFKSLRCKLNRSNRMNIKKEKTLYFLVFTLNIYLYISPLFCKYQIYLKLKKQFSVNLIWLYILFFYYVYIPS